MSPCQLDSLWAIMRGSPRNTSVMWSAEFLAPCVASVEKPRGPPKFERDPCRPVSSWTRSNCRRSGLPAMNRKYSGQNMVYKKGLKFLQLIACRIRTPYTAHKRRKRQKMGGGWVSKNTKDQGTKRKRKGRRKRSKEGWRRPLWRQRRRLRSNKRSGLRTGARPKRRRSRKLLKPTSSQVKSAKFHTKGLGAGVNSHKATRNARQNEGQRLGSRDKNHLASPKSGGRGVPHAHRLKKQALKGVAPLLNFDGHATAVQQLQDFAPDRKIIQVVACWGTDRTRGPSSELNTKEAP